jgi:hypothetical protein
MSLAHTLFGLDEFLQKILFIGDNEDPKNPSASLTISATMGVLRAEKPVMSFKERFIYRCAQHYGLWIGNGELHCQRAFLNEVSSVKQEYRDKYEAVTRNLVDTIHKELNVNVISPPKTTPAF